MTIKTKCLFHSLNYIILYELNNVQFGHKHQYLFNLTDNITDDLFLELKTPHSAKFYFLNRNSKLDFQSLPGNFIEKTVSKEEPRKFGNFHEIFGKFYEKFVLEKLHLNILRPTSITYIFHLVCMYLCICIWVYNYVCNICVKVCMYVCIYVCMYM